MKRILIGVITVICCLLLFACVSDVGDDSPVTPPVTPPVTLPDDDGSGLSEQDESPSEEPQDDITAPEPTPEQQLDDGSESGTAVSIPATGEVVISFDYTRQTGPASNQHAVWIEDMEGRLVRSLFASRWTANGGFARRPDSIALWAERAGLADMSKAEVDAVACATPSTGPQSYTWDLTDLNGDTVLQGDYVFFVEGTLRWKNFVLFSGVITVGDEPVTVQGEATFHYEGSDRYDALTADSVENNMIGPVTAVFVP